MAEDPTPPEHADRPAPPMSHLDTQNDMTPDDVMRAARTAIYTWAKDGVIIKDKAIDDLLIYLWIEGLKLTPHGDPHATPTNTTDVDPYYAALTTKAPTPPGDEFSKAFEQATYGAQGEHWTKENAPGWAGISADDGVAKSFDRDAWAAAGRGGIKLEPHESEPASHRTDEAPEVEAPKVDLSLRGAADRLAKEIDDLEAFRTYAWDVIEGITGRPARVFGHMPRMDRDLVGYWRHKKRGTTYSTQGLARVQCSTGPMVDGEIVLLYCDTVTGEYSIRRQSEFSDGRFVPVDR